MRSEWVVLADAGRARIFARVGGAGWQDIRDFTRNGASGGHNGREVRLPHAMRKIAHAAQLAPSEDNDFIERLGRELKAARKRGEFDILALIAPSEVLDALVSELDAGTRKVLKTTASENLVGLPVREARRALARRF